MRHLLLALLFAGAPALAQQASAGAELGLLLKAEPDGRHTARPELGLRGELGVARNLSLGAVYSVSHGREGARFSAAAWEHGLDVRASFVLPLATSHLTLGAGPAGRLATFDLYDGAAKVASRTDLALGLGAGAAVVAEVGSWHLRVGGDGTWLRGQLDLRLSAGAVFPLGGAR